MTPVAGMRTNQKPKLILVGKGEIHRNGVCFWLRSIEAKLKLKIEGLLF